VKSLKNSFQSKSACGISDFQKFFQKNFKKAIDRELLPESKVKSSEGGSEDKARSFPPFPKDKRSESKS
jgi:hypothetical protein